FARPGHRRSLVLRIDQRQESLPPAALRNRPLRFTLGHATPLPDELPGRDSRPPRSVSPVFPGAPYRTNTARFLPALSGRGRKSSCRTDAGSRMSRVPGFRRQGYSRKVPRAVAPCPFADPTGTVRESFAGRPATAADLGGFLGGPDGQEVVRGQSDLR